MQTAVAHLQAQLRQLRQQPIAGFCIEPDETNIFLWRVYFAGPAGSLYEGGTYRATLQFPQDFPFKPPEMRVLSTFWHPNVYEDGRVCISVLHAPGVDEMNTVETAAMRWTPVQTIEKVLIAVVSLLSDPDPAEAGAPANVDALVMFRKQRAEYARRCKANAEKSVTEVPPHVVIPTQDAAPKREPSFQTYYSSGFDAEDEAPPAAAATGYEEEIAQIRKIAAGTEKTDEELVELLKKYKRDVDRVLESLW